TVERLCVSAGDPDLVLEDVGAVLVAFLPDDVRLQLLPVLAVLGVPNVVPVAGGVVGPAANHPDVTTICHSGVPQPRVPRGLVGRLLPVDAVGREPDVVLGPVVGDVVAAAQNPELVVVHNDAVIRTRRPRCVGGFLFPI